MKKAIKIIIFLLVIFFPIQIKGYCTTEEKLRYSSLASSIVTSYDYVEKDSGVTFSVTIHNVHSDLIVVDNNTGKRYTSKLNKLNNFTITNLKDGVSYKFDVYANNSSCPYRVYNTLYVTLPKYNKYYKEPICSDASDYLYCQKWAETGNISYDELVELVKNHKKKPDEEIITEKDPEDNWIYIIGNFWANNYIYISTAIIIICISIIIIKDRKDRFDF
ncbi:MAG: hypothetical protein E7173_01730 [Firmicutes bacterium]|nr:hypothetical protein [Bacillota bacterium]